MASPIFEIVNRLSSIERFTMEKLASRETVIEHVGIVAFFTLALATEVNQRGTEVDIADALSRALCHDLDEIITGDVARPTKYASLRATRLFHELSETAIHKISQKTMGNGFKHFGYEMQRAFLCAKANDKAGAIVALADVLAVAAKVGDEVLTRGNRGMVRQAYTSRNQLCEMDRRIIQQFTGPDHNAMNFLRNVVDDAIKTINKACAVDAPDDVEEY